MTDDRWTDVSTDSSARVVRDPWARAIAETGLLLSAAAALATVVYIAQRDDCPSGYVQLLDTPVLVASALVLVVVYAVLVRLARRPGHHPNVSSMAAILLVPVLLLAALVVFASVTGPVEWCFAF
jgi:hypothetical protein